MKLPGIFLAAFVVLGLGILSPLVINPYKPQPEPQGLPRIGEAPVFQLTDAMDRDFSSAELQGKIWIANFFFTSCEGPCPTMSANMAVLNNHYKDKQNIRLVSISVDPETDTPEMLRMYAAKFGADTSKWHILTGASKETLTDILSGFKLGAGEEPAMHNTRFVLVDQTGQVRRYYHGTDQSELKRMRADIGLLLKNS